MSDGRFRIVLVRHGLTDWNEDGRLMGRCDVELNSRGRQQAERVADALRGVSIGAIYSSPQPRAQQTAEPIGAALGLEVVVDNGFDEVWLSEAWKGKTVGELRGDDDLERIIADPTYQSDAIEPIVEVQKRGVGAVERLRDSRPKDTLVVVSHGDPLRVIIAHYLGLDLPVFRRLACDNGSVSALCCNRRGTRLELLNWAPQVGSGSPHALKSS